ncbi:hypothetical protein QYE76_029638 [Lolium multiflorum]|uniref:L-gulonolactone oxidase n=1 Tax=Lolium multiflorum TaxID=4521 RepID=A0AAD8QPC0_LOLMU|nr:hypothetical protein QYE76_029638 [Lolium multiflorum]
MVLVVLLLGLLLAVARSSSSPEPVACAHGTSNCTVTNAYGSFPDRTICRAANATFPSTEQELVAAVAAAAAAKRKVKAATKHSHSFPKLACPGGSDGTIISTERLNRTVSVDTSSGLMTVESGMLLKDLIQDAAAAGLALPHSPYWTGLTIGGLLATGAHGSSLWGKGSAVHEYVVGMRIVTPAPASQGFAVVRELGIGDPDLDAVKVSLGVLGVVSQPMFKRSVTLEKRDDTDFAAQAAVWGDLHEFGDMTWLPWLRKVIYRSDNRVTASTPGNSLNDYIGFRANPTLMLTAARAVHDFLEKYDSNVARWLAARVPSTLFELHGNGFTTNGSFKGFPVVGFQNRIQASGTCISSPENYACPWDPRIPGPFFYSSGFSIAVSKAPAYIVEVQKLRDHNPRAFCDLDAMLGVLLRYVRSSSAYLGNSEDSIIFDFTYYRSFTEGEPRAHADVMDELEQLALNKYGAIPHWGKNRNYAFDGVIAKYPKAQEFLKVKARYDPDGIFSSEWSDQVLGINGSPNVVGRGCAIEGLCVCSDDSHCAPMPGKGKGKDYSCVSGKVFVEARVCSRRPCGSMQEL